MVATPIRELLNLPASLVIDPLAEIAQIDTSYDGATEPLPHEIARELRDGPSSGRASDEITCYRSTNSRPSAFPHHEKLEKVRLTIRLVLNLGHHGKAAKLATSTQSASFQEQR
jgi:hypothetical protein